MSNFDNSRKARIVVKPLHPGGRARFDAFKVMVYEPTPPKNVVQKSDVIVFGLLAYVGYKIYRFLERTAPKNDDDPPKDDDEVNNTRYHTRFVLHCT